MASTMKFSIMFIFMILLSFTFQASADTGVATLNGPPYLPSACYGFTDKGVMIGAVAQNLWGGGAACGKYFQVTCTGPTYRGEPHPCTNNPTVTVLITDFCPPVSCQGDIDLSHESFSMIANPDAGEIEISYQML